MPDPLLLQIAGFLKILQAVVLLPDSLYKEADELMEKIGKKLAEPEEPECNCSGGPQGDGLCELPHEEGCPAKPR